MDPETFASYRLTEADVAALDSWALAWETDVRARLASGETGPSGVPDDKWNAYLDPA